MVNSASFIFLNTSAVRSFTCCGVNTEGEKEITHAGFLLASPIMYSEAVSLSWFPLLGNCDA